MNRLDIVRAWKDEEYRMTLSDAERAALPENPVGSLEIDAAIERTAGGNPRGFQNTSPLVCQIVPVSVLVKCPIPTVHFRPCPPRTIPPQCPPKTHPPRCPLKTLALSCPNVSLTCPNVSLACPF